MNNITNQDIKEWLPVFKKLEIEANGLGVDFELFATRLMEHISNAKTTYPDDKVKSLAAAASAMYEEFYERRAS